MAKPEKWHDKEFEEKVYSYFHTRVPDKVFDAHAHITKRDFKDVAPEEMLKKEIEGYERLLGKGKYKGGVMMGNPNLFETQEAYDDERLFSCECYKGYDGFFVTGLLVRPWDGEEDVLKWLNIYPTIGALKVYWVYGKDINCETDILEFAPEWVWKIADDRKMAVILHLSHDSEGLAHPKNIEQLRFISKKYPNAKIQLAHCGMGHNPYMFKSLLHIFIRLNILTERSFSLPLTATALQYIILVNALVSVKALWVYITVKIFLPLHLPEL